MRCEHSEMKRKEPGSQMKKDVPFTRDEAALWRQSYPTPFYVYDEETIRNTALSLREAFGWAPGYREYFAVKALPNPEILRILHDCGCGADCASISEVTLCRKVGMMGEEMIFTSNETTAEEYRTAKEAGAILNLDDITHIDFVEEVCGLPDTVCLRYNPGQFQIANGIMGKQSDSKFGMTPGQVLEACRVLKDKGVRHFGLHAMLASCSLEESYYPSLAQELFSFAVNVREQTGVSFELIDLAGGIGIPYRPEEKKVDILAVGEAVREVYEKILTPAGLAPKLATELGRFVTGPSGYLVTSVLHHKHTYKECVGVDATACNLMRPAIYGAYHHITVLGKENMPNDTVVDVVGSLCENNDKFAVDRPLPAVERGDILVIHDAGAHGYSMGYNYNGKLRCAEFLLRRGHTLKMIRRAETLNDYFATLDIDPAFRD